MCVSGVGRNVDKFNTEKSRLGKECLFQMVSRKQKRLRSRKICVCIVNRTNDWRMSAADESLSV